MPDPIQAGTCTVTSNSSSTRHGSATAAAGAMPAVLPLLLPFATGFWPGVGGASQLAALVLASPPPYVGSCTR